MREKWLEEQGGDDPGETQRLFTKEGIKANDA
jgi:hypothetical protein